MDELDYLYVDEDYNKGIQNVNEICSILGITKRYNSIEELEADSNWTETIVEALENKVKSDDVLFLYEQVTE